MSEGPLPGDPPPGGPAPGDPLSRDALSTRRGRRWQAALLALQPPLSLAYLLAMRSGLARPSFVAVVALLALPGAWLLCRRATGAPARAAGTAIAVAELLWALVCGVIVNIAHVWRLD